MSAGLMEYNLDHNHLIFIAMASMNSSDDSTHGAGKINVKRSDGLKHDLVSVLTGLSPANIFGMMKKGGKVIHVKEPVEVEHDHGNIKLHRSDGLNCDIIRVFKGMSDANGESLQKNNSPTNDQLIHRSSMTKIEVQSLFSSSGPGVNVPVFPRSDLSNSPTSARIIHMANTINRLVRSSKRSFLPEGDILIHSGGFTVDGTVEEYAQFNDWLGSVKNLYHYRVIIAGLSDVKECGNDWDFVKNSLPNATHVLCHSEATVLGMRIYGCPWHWAHDSTYNLKLGAPSSSSGRFDEIPKGIHILVTHGPAFGRMDLIGGGWSSVPSRKGHGKEHPGQSTQSQRSGSRELEEAIKITRPGLHLHGLAAENRGVSFSGYAPLTLNSCMSDPSGSILCSCPHVVRCNLLHSSKEGDDSQVSQDWDFSLDSLI